MKQIIVDNQFTPYYISEKGECFNSKTNRFLKGQYSNSGYLNFYLTLSTGKKRLYSHRLVAQYFLNDGKPISEGKEVNHKDGNKKNNDKCNLEIISHTNNLRHAVDIDLIRSKRIFCFDSKLQIVKSFKNLYEVCKETGFDKATINQELGATKKRLTYDKFYWSYSSELSEDDIITFENTGKAKTVYQYDKKGNFLAEYSSTGEAARKNFPEFKRASSHIGECCRRRIKTYKNFIWRYKDDIV